MGRVRRERGVYLVRNQLVPKDVGLRISVLKVKRETQRKESLPKGMHTRRTGGNDH